MAVRYSLEVYPNKRHVFRDEQEKQRYVEEERLATRKELTLFYRAITKKEREVANANLMRARQAFFEKMKPQLL